MNRIDPKFLLTTWLLTAILSGFSPASAQDYQLVFEDAFDGTTVDTSYWTFQIGDGTSEGLPPGWGNNELQYYRAENTTVADGLLTISAREERFEGYDYTSSRLITRDKQNFTYGRFEMRARLPLGQGLWPAFWMLFSPPGAYGGWAASGEVDIMEYIGSAPNEVFGTLHYGAPFPGNVFSTTEYTLPEGNFSDDFHTFALEWEPGEIRWFVDDVLYATQTNWWSNGGAYPAPFDQDFYLLLNLAVGGNLPGNPDETTVFPQEYVIDYVRVFEDVSLPTVTLDNPADGANLATGDDLTLRATPEASEGVARVAFFQGDLMLGEVAEPPYELTVSGVATGSYRVRATVTDNNGKVNYSDFANITVGEGGQGPYALLPTPLPGTIETENYDVGGNTIAFRDNDPDLNQGSRNSGNRYRSHEGVDLEPVADAEDNHNIGLVNAGEWTEYTVVVAEAGAYDIRARVASATGGTFRLVFDDQDSTSAINFGPTGGASTWVEVSRENVPLAAGPQVVRLQMLSGGFNIDRLTFAPADPRSGELVIFDDMEHGAPSENGWFVFNGEGGGGIDANRSDLPPTNGGTFSLQTGWGSGGTPGFFGGFGRAQTVDIAATTHFNFWINPDANQNYTLAINLQDDEDLDGTVDDEFQYNLTVADTGTAVRSGGGWQLVSIPLDDFTDDNSFVPETDGNGALDSIVTNVVWAVTSNSGADITFRTDFWSFTNGPLGPEIDVAPLSYDFGAVGLGISRTQTITIANQGRSPLEVTEVFVRGADSSDFVVLTQASFVVEAGSSRDVAVRYTPSSLGSQQAALVVSSTDADEATTVVPLTGEGVEPPDVRTVVFDDMEHGAPLENGWFTFTGSGGGGIDPNSTDLPPANGGMFSLQTGWGSGGTPGFFGGFGRVETVDISGMNYFNFWINPDSSQNYTLEINLQEDDDGDGLFPFPAPNDDEFQFNLEVGPNGKHAISGGGWQLVSIPLAAFFDDNSIHGGNGVFDPVPVEEGGNGTLLSIVIAVISNSGADVTFRTDAWVFSDKPLDPADIDVVPTALDFGAVAAGDSASQDITITNTGTANLWVSDLTLSGPGATAFAVIDSGEWALPGGASRVVPVLFRSPSPAIDSLFATLTITSNDPDEPALALSLTGPADDRDTPRYLLLAEQDITIRAPEYFNGNLHANDDIHLKEGLPSVYLSDVSAVSDLTIAAYNVIQGDARAGDNLTIGSEVVVKGIIEGGKDVGSVPLPELNFVAGGQEVLLRANQVLTLAPGSYGVLLTKKNAGLHLSAGDYFFEEFSLGKGATVSIDVSDGPVAIYVEDQVTIKNRAKVKYDSLAEGNLLFSLNSLDDIDLGKEVHFEGGLVAPYGKVTVGKNATFRGAMSALEIDIRPHGSFSFYQTDTTDSVYEVPDEWLAARQDSMQQKPSGEDRKEQFSVYPNPSSGVLTVWASEDIREPVRVIIADTRGQIKYARTLPPGPSKTVDLKHLYPGLYLIRIEGAGERYQQRLVLQP